MTWAITQKTGNPAAKVVLLSLANYANADAECWPKIATIADETEMSARSVHAHLTALRDRGLIDWRHQARPDGSQTANIYRLIMAPDGPVTGREGANAQFGGSAKSADPPLQNLQTPPARSADQVEPVSRTSHGTRGGDSRTEGDTRAPARAESPPTPEPPPNPEPAAPPPPAGDTGGIPPRRCPEHIRTLGPVPACGACKEARLVAEQWEAAHPVSTANARNADTAPKHPACPDCHAPAPAGHCARCARNLAVATPGAVHALRAALPGRQRRPAGRRRECPHGRPVAWLDAAGTVEACPDCRRGVPGPESAADGVTGQRAATG